MALFITQCPHCMTSFRTSITQLQSAEGMVRCGACLKIFVADDNLVPSPDLRTVNVPPAETSEQQLQMEEVENEFTDSIFTLDLADSLPNRREPAISDDQPIWELLDEDVPLSEHTEHEAEHEFEQESDQEERPEQVEKQESASHDLPENEAVQGFGAADFHEHDLDEYADTHSHVGFTPENLAAARDISDPLELHWQAPGGRGRHIFLMGFLAFLLTAGLFAQFVWYNLSELSQNITARPWLEKSCSLLNCTLPPLINISSISSDNLLVRSHSEIANALTVNLVFRNDAPFPQPFPALILRFTDVNNSIVAERLFTPEEYLSADVATMSMMPVDSPVQITLDVLDPGSSAINYEVSFSPMFSQPRL